MIRKMISMAGMGLLWLILRLRWAYFHVNPNYVKFKMSPTEFHFWNKRTNSIHSDIIILWRKNETHPG